MPSAETPTVFLDRDLRVRRFTEAYGRMTRILPGDIGRPVSDVIGAETDVAMVGDCRRVLDGEPVADREFHFNRDTWYLRRILPCRSREGALRGVLVTYLDVTALKDSEFELERRNAQLETHLSGLPHPFEQRGPSGVDFGGGKLRHHIKGVALLRLRMP